MRVVVSNSAEGLVDLLQLDPAKGLSRLARYNLVTEGAGGNYLGGVPSQRRSLRGVRAQQ